MRVPSLGVVLHLAVISAVIGDDAPPPRWTLTAECQMVILPAKLAATVVPALSDDGTIEQAWEKLQPQIASGEVKLVSQLHLKGNTGKKLETQTAEGLPYPTEFNPPQAPNNVPVPPEQLKNWPLVGFAPTALEWREVGTRLELQAEASADGQLLDAQITPQHVRFLRFVKYDAGVLPNGDHLSISQPIFHTCRSNLSLYLRSGQRVLVGIHTLPADEGVELFLLRITTHPVPSIAVKVNAPVKTGPQP